MKQTITFLFCLFIVNFSLSQTPDTLGIVHLNEVTIIDHQSLGGVDRMPAIKENVIYAGKKNEVIQLDRINADLSTNNTRQIFAKVPGMSIWENDGSGIQVGIAARGLSPNRSWEFNMRQNGHDISADAFGYPESYYNPPMEALSRIEVVRGAASLQFGPQFGGLINYQMKKGHPNKAFSFESSQTVGSYGMLNTYNAIGGTIKKFSYYAFFHKRTAEGWRENSQYDVNTGYFSAAYQLNRSINISATYTKMDYISQQPGGLTTDQYNSNHRQSHRERNWFNVPWNVASLTADIRLSSNVNLQIKSFMTIAERNSVGFLQSINVNDTINAETLQYAKRQVDREEYKNYGSEARVSAKYKLLNAGQTVAFGIRAYQGKTTRYQKGIGTTGTDFDLSLTDPIYGKSIELGVNNYSAFAENIFQLGHKLKIVPGVRYEMLQNTISGYISTASDGGIRSEKRDRHILLYGTGVEYTVTEKTNIYGNYSQAYRPVTFSELTPSSTTEIVDANLKDAFGFNADLGYRGAIKNYLNFDVGVFYVAYENRIGVITQNNTPFKTNIGASVSKGIESYIEFDPLAFAQLSRMGSLSLFASNAFVDARYTTWNNPAIADDPTKSIEGKRVENAPQYIHRFGATYSYKSLAATFQASMVGDVFTDAANTDSPNAAATTGKISGYNVMDASLSYGINEHFNIKAGVNNLANEKYATRRSGGYPGPGLLPGNGRTIYLNMGVKF